MAIFTTRIKEKQTISLLFSILVKIKAVIINIFVYSRKSYRYDHYINKVELP